MEQRTRLVPAPQRKLSTLERELSPYAQCIRQSGVEAIWKIGEQLLAAKARVIELTGDRRAPGFAQWTHHTFGWSKSTVSRYIKAFEHKNEDLKQIWGNKSVASTQPTEWFTYNIWHISQGDGKEFFGHFALLHMKNLLYRHTQEGDLVFDPFAGSETTIQACQEMNRRYWVSDLIPQSKRAHRHNILDGWPKRLRETPDLAFLDPPYWIQARGRYSDLPEDLGNMSLDDFYAAMRGLFRTLEAHKVPKIACVVQGSQYKNKHHDYEDHILEFAKMLKSYRVKMRYILPLESKQYVPQQVIVMKPIECMVVHRDLVVWEREK